MVNIDAQFPIMKPWIGKHYAHSRKKLLILGESHYLPGKKSVDTPSHIHLDPVKWYAASESDLSPVEKEWVNTQGVIQEAIDTNFKNKAHRGIYGNVATKLNEQNPCANKSETLHYISFYNFFKRPAEEGESLKQGKFLPQQDIDVAVAYLKAFIQTHKPELIIFVSRLAAQYGKVAVPENVPFISTPHPGSAWWNRTAPSYGGRTGKKLFSDFIREHGW